MQKMYLTIAITAIMVVVFAFTSVAKSEENIGKGEESLRTTSIPVIGEIVLPDGIEDFTKFENKETGSFNSIVSYLQYCKSKDYCVSLIIQFNNVDDVDPVLLLAYINGEYRYWYYVGNLYIKEITSEKAKGIVRDVLEGRTLKKEYKL